MAGTSAAPGVCWLTGTTPAAGEGREARIAGTSPMSRVVGFSGAATTAGAWGGRPESQTLPDWKAQLWTNCHCCPVTCGHGASVAGRSHVHHLLLLPGSWRLRAQSLLPQGLASLLGDLLLCPNSASSMCSNPLTFVHTDVWLSGILVCWAEEPLWSYECFTSFRLKETKRASHTNIMLTSLPDSDS